MPPSHSSRPSTSLWTSYPNPVLIFILSTLEEILYSVHIERQREAQRLIERVRLCGGDDVAGIEREDAHAEACAHGEVLAITLVLRLVVVAGTHRELIVVDILGTKAPAYLLHLLLKSARCVAEALEHTTD